MNENRNDLLVSCLGRLDKGEETSQAILLSLQECDLVLYEKAFLLVESGSSIHNALYEIKKDTMDKKLDVALSGLIQVCRFQNFQKQLLKDAIFVSEE